MPSRTPPAGRPTRLSVERLDDRINPATPTLITPNPVVLSGANAAWDYGAGVTFTPSPVFADVDGQPGQELVTVTGDGKVAAYKWNGNAVTLLRTYDTGPGARELHASPLVVTLPGVGPAVFAGGMDGRVFGWNAATGALLPGWPSTVDVPAEVYPLAGMPNEILGHLGAGDLDGDGTPEIVALSFNQQVTALRANGSLLWRYSQDDTILSGVAVGDLDRDGKSEVVFGGDFSQNEIYDAGGSITALTGEGRRKWVKFIDGQIGQSAPVLADVTGDGKLEVFAGTGLNFSNLNGVPFPGNAVLGLDPDGNDLPGWPYSTGPSNVDARTPSPPAVGDVNGDGKPEIVIGDYSGKLQALNANGTALWRVQTAPGPLYAAPLIADVTGDGRPDVVQLSNIRALGFDGATGQANWSYTEPTGTAQYTNSAAIGQFKGDGSTQIALLANGLVNRAGVPPLGPSSLRFFDVPATAVAPAWAAARGDASANAVARPDSFAVAYATGLAAYLGRDANGTAALVAGYRPALRVAANLTPLTDGVLGSFEGRSTEVRRWYALYLGRSADQPGVNNWVNYLGTGKSFAQGQALILQSQEAFDRSGPNGPASATNQTWVVALYRAVLGRGPANGEESGWVNSLNAGRIQRSDVALGFLLSTEYTQRVVRQWYATYRLGNGTPSPEGLTAASWDLRRGVREEVVLGRLLTQGLAGGVSDYLAVHPEGSWLRGLYQDVLNRPLGTADAAHWLGQMEAGSSYTTVATAIVRSVENNTRIAQSYFTRYLRRASVPSAASVAGFTARLNAGERRESVIASVLQSDEYFNRVGGTRDAFIFAVYGDLLGPGRAPDSTSLAYWRSRPNVRGELPGVLMTSDEYAFATIKDRFYEALRRYPNTPSNLSSLLNSTPPGGDSFASVRGFINQLLANGQQSDIEITVVTSAEYLGVARTRAFWGGKRWKQ